MCDWLRKLGVLMRTSGVAVSRGLNGTSSSQFSSWLGCAFLRMTSSQTGSFHLVAKWLPAVRGSYPSYLKLQWEIASPFPMALKNKSWEGLWLASLGHVPAPGARVGAASSEPMDWMELLLNGEGSSLKGCYLRKKIMSTALTIHTCKCTHTHTHTKRTHAQVHTHCTWPGNFNLLNLPKHTHSLGLLLVITASGFCTLLQTSASRKDQLCCLKHSTVTFFQKSKGALPSFY